MPKPRTIDCASPKEAFGLAFAGALVATGDFGAAVRAPVIEGPRRCAASEPARRAEGPGEASHGAAAAPAVAGETCPLRGRAMALPALAKELLACSPVRLPERSCAAAAPVQAWQVRAPLATEQGALPMALPQTLQTTQSMWKEPRLHFIALPSIALLQLAHFSPCLSAKHLLQKHIFECTL